MHVAYCSPAHRVWVSTATCRCHTDTNDIDVFETGAVLRVIALQFLFFFLSMDMVLPLVRNFRSPMVIFFSWSACGLAVPPLEGRFSILWWRGSQTSQHAE
jgi:hypothetical protein